MGFETKKEAAKRAREVKALLTTRGWEIRLWENNGWHWELRNEFLRVSDAWDGKFYAMVSDHLEYPGTPLAWSLDRYFKDPNRAVKAVAAHVRGVIRAKRAIEDKVLLSIDAILKTGKKSK